MKTLPIKFTAILSIISLSLINFPLKAEAQFFDSETNRTLGICNTIMYMQDADPNNLELRIARRECNLRAYNVRLCTASGYEFVACWDHKYIQPVHITTEELENVIINNQ
jgi:hypothetical protein